jgi:hypothetical protein
VLCGVPECAFHGVCAIDADSREFKCQCPVCTDNNGITVCGKTLAAFWSQ